ncbi:MAG: hypothetical protein ACRDJL_08725 [Actinomycetota bacterium]
MEHNPERFEPAEAVPPGGLRDRARQVLEDAAARGDGERLKLLEDLYNELERELERDVGETPSTRR